MTEERARGMVQTMFERTHLPVEAILGAYAIVEKGGLPCTARNLIAASFAAFKAYTTASSRLVSVFQSEMVPALRKTDLAAPATMRGCSRALDKHKKKPPPRRGFLITANDLLRTTWPTKR